MSFREMIGEEAAHIAETAERTKEILAAQFTSDAELAHLDRASRAEYESLVAEGARTSASEIYSQGEVADIEEFLLRMEQNGHRGAIDFATPPPPLQPVVVERVVEPAPPTVYVPEMPTGNTPKERLGIWLIKDTVLKDMTTPPPAPEVESSDNGHIDPVPQPLPQSVYHGRGYVIGTMTIPANWTSARDAMPQLAVLFTDGTVGVVNSTLDYAGRIAPRTTEQPLPLRRGADGNYPRPEHGFYAPRIPLGDVEISDEVAQYLPAPAQRMGAAFMSPVGGLGDVLMAHYNRHGIRPESIAVVPALGLGASSPNGSHGLLETQTAD